MAFKIASEPDCSGMCKEGITFGVSAIAVITSSVKSFGCGEVNRPVPSRRSFRTPEAAWRRRHGHETPGHRH